MPGNEDKADVFAIPDLWQTPKLLDQLGQAGEPPYFATELKGTDPQLTALLFAVLSLGFKIASIPVCYSLRRLQSSSMASSSSHLSKLLLSSNPTPT